MRRLTKDFVHEIYDIYVEKHSDQFEEPIKSLMEQNAKQVAYIFVLAFNKLVDEGYFD